MWTVVESGKSKYVPYAPHDYKIYLFSFSLLYYLPP